MKFSFLKFFLSVLLGIAMVFSGAHVQTAQATSVLALSDMQLTQMASTIVHGKITHMEAFRYDGGIVLTRIDLEVYQQLKPNPREQSPEHLTFFTRGGTLDGITQKIPGEFVPTVGIEVVVFLEEIPRFENRLFVLGLRQGAFWVDDLPMTRVDQKPAKRTQRAIFTAPQTSAFEKAQMLEDLLTAIQWMLKNAPH